MQRYISLSTASATDLLRLGVYYCQRLITSPWIRHCAHRVLVFVLRRRHPRLVSADARSSDAVSQFRHLGYVQLPPLLSTEQCMEMRAYLATCTLLDSKGRGQAISLTAIPEACSVGDYPLRDVVNCPYVMATANHQDMMGLAIDYLGFAPVITGLSLRWTFPSSAGPDKVQSFHRDCEVGSIKLMVYLTDVDANAGPHTFARGTHLDRMPVRLRNHSDDEVRGEHVEMLGPAGTTFVIDTRGLHKGSMPRERPRLMLGVQYSLLPCPLFDYETVPYTGPAELLHYVNRLMVAA